jgi:hypothetical protein
MAGNGNWTVEDLFAVFAGDDAEKTASAGDGPAQGDDGEKPTDDASKTAGAADDRNMKLAGDNVDTLVKFAEFCFNAGEIQYDGLRSGMEKHAAASSLYSHSEPGNDDAKWKNVTNALHARRRKNMSPGDSELPMYDGASGGAKGSAA